MISSNRALPCTRRHIPPRINSREYNGDLRFIRILCDEGYLHKLKQPVKNNICFLEKISFGETEGNVRKILGEPFFIYRKNLSGMPHTVYTYGLKSGINKLKVELHFLEKHFFLGTIFYNAENINDSDLNRYFRETFNLGLFHFKRDIIVDPSDNFLEFHYEPNCFIITFSQMKWIRSTPIFQNSN
jgi:hypothetical protein